MRHAKSLSSFGAAVIMFAASYFVPPRWLLISLIAGGVVLLAVAALLWLAERDSSAANGGKAGMLISSNAPGSSPVIGSHSVNIIGSSIGHLGSVSTLDHGSIDSSPFSGVPASKAAAERVIKSELTEVLNKISRLKVSPVLSDGFELPHGEWEKHRHTIADDADLYRVVDAAYSEIYRVNDIWGWRRSNATTRLIGANLATDDLGRAEEAASLAIKRLEGKRIAESFYFTYATYGVDDQTIDPLDRLNARIREGKINFVVSNALMGGDPVPNKPKTLIVRWVVNGQEFSSSFSEGTHVALPD